MMGAVLVTGATGNVGGALVRALLREGLEVVAAGSDEAAVRARFEDSVAAVRLDFRDRRTWPAALRGVRRMFLMRPPAIANVEETILPFIDAARAAGVDVIVFLSVAGAERNRFLPHRRVEQHLGRLDVHHTNLRPGFFAQNLETAYRTDIVRDGRIYVPAGDAPVNWIDAMDIAAVAAVVLAAPEPHRQKSYTLTGPGPVAWAEVTGALSEVLGRHIRYEPASVPGYVLHLARAGTPLGAIAVQTVLHVLLRFGGGTAYDSTLERLLGRPGRRIREYVVDNAHVWRPER